MSLDPEKIYHEVVTAGIDFADKKAAYELLSDLTKTVLADLVTDFLSSCSSKGEAESRGLASKAYKDHLASLSAARRAWLLAEVRYKSFQMLGELRRSEESTRRAEMQL